MNIDFEIETINEAIDLLTEIKENGDIDPEFNLPTFELNNEYRDMVYKLIADYKTHPNPQEFLNYGINYLSGQLETLLVLKQRITEGLKWYSKKKWKKS